MSCRIDRTDSAAYFIPAMHKALTAHDVMKMSRAEKKRRADDWMRRKMMPARKQPAPPPHPMLKRWVKPEKPIEIIG
jgi:hypothetical protein